MRYLEARKLIKTGDILACEGTAFYSKLIRVITKSRITHVGVAVWIRFPDNNEDRLAIIESHAMKGVRIAPLSEVLREDYWKRKGKIHWQKIEDTRISGHNVAANALKRWNKSYANWYQFLVLGSFTLKTIRYMCGKSMDTDNKSQHCSELVTRALMEAGYRHGLDPSITTPADVSSFACLSECVELEECPCYNRNSESSTLGQCTDSNMKDNDGTASQAAE